MDYKKKCIVRAINLDSKEVTLLFENSEKGQVRDFITVRSQDQMLLAINALKNQTELELVISTKKIPSRLCSVCQEYQFETPSGLVCKNGHGGAESIEYNVLDERLELLENPKKGTFSKLTDFTRELLNNNIACKDDCDDILTHPEIFEIAARQNTAEPDLTHTFFSENIIKGGLLNCA